jgi:hypothetical protein
MTTRKHFRHWRFAAALCGAALGTGGCATPGPLHVYSLATATATTIDDAGPVGAAPTPSFIAPGESVTGFAYDPFTDHFFLRLAPGNRIRVVDRPARAIKREFLVEKIPPTGGGDVAVRPRDGHMFFANPKESVVIETTRLGVFVREFGLQFPAAGVAYDSAHDRLLALFKNASLVASVDRDSITVETIALSPFMKPAPIGFDSDRREFYVPFAGKPRIGVFDEAGHLQRVLPIAAEFLDVGPRSFLRMF